MQRKRKKDKFIFGKSHFAGRDFGDGERTRGKTWDKYIFLKSHFEDEERLRRSVLRGERLRNF
jgi:hypothetical protein